MNKLRDSIQEIRKNLPENFSLELENNPGLYYKDGYLSQEGRPS